MNAIVLAILVVAALGLIAGLVLAVASALLAVPRDEKVEALREALPGVNCGACGYSGCDGYAEAMAHEGEKPGLCAPGGAAVAELTASILGVETEVEIKTAMVRCGGCEAFTARKLDYEGVPSCAAASQFYGGDWKCNYGCLGYGDCVKVCEYGAITVEDGLARIDPALCRACGLCVKECPKSLITILPGRARGVVRCSSHDKGAVVRKACTVGCIACHKCEKACRYDAIHVNGFLAAIDPEKCVGCGACAETCPVQCIDIFGKVPSAEPAAPEPAEAGHE